MNNFCLINLKFVICKLSHYYSQNNFILLLNCFMRTSIKSFKNQSMELRNHQKKPKDYVDKLNKQISNVQNAVKQFNQSQQRQMLWKKQYRMKGHSCPLKTLTEPKFQNILLQNNFNNKSLIFKGVNQSNIKNSVLSKRNLSKKNSLYQTNFGLKKTFSFMSNSRQIQNRQNRALRNSESKILSNRTMEKAFHNTTKKAENNQNANPQNQIQQSTKFAPQQFVSFRQQVGRFDKLVYLSKNNYKQNYSTKNARINNFVDLSNLQEGNSNSVYFKNGTDFNDRVTDINDKLTVVDQQSKSIMLDSNMKFFDKLKSDSKESLLLPITQQKFIRTINSGVTSRRLRTRIQQKTIQLQKQWQKTENYRQKYNILQAQATVQLPSSKRSRIVNKLDNIIKKVQQRRPKTSMKSQQLPDNLRQSTDESRLSTFERVNSSPNQNGLALNYFAGF